VIPPFSHSIDIVPGQTESLRAVPAFAGVYLLTDERDQPILLAHAENMRRAVSYRLAASERDERTKRADLSAVSRRLHWIETFSSFETTWLHYCAARELYPRAYREMIGFGPAWFIRVDSAAAFPRFTATDKLRDDAATHVGPMATSKDADEWIHMLEDAFDLCRYFHVLEKAPLGERCAYYDMGKCPAPCDGTIAMDAYRSMMRAALDFTLGSRESPFERARERMRHAAGALEFEKAATIRKSLESAEELAARPEYAHLCDVRKSAWLVIERGSRRSRSAKKLCVRPFYVRSGSIVAGEAVQIQRLDEVIETWCKTANDLGSYQSTGNSRTENPAWSISLLSRFLFQEKQPLPLIFRADRLLEAGVLAARVRSHFERIKSIEEDELNTGGLPSSPQI